jgi:hypothetical protein
MTGIKCDVWRFKMVEVELNKIMQHTNLKLHGTIELFLLEDKYQEIFLAQRTAEGSDNYYLHYHALRCEISEASAQELIALGARLLDLDDLKNFRV